MADKTWRDRLLPASFRGVGFWVDSETTPAGRRVQVHEYPQRGKPMVEDMGAKTRAPKMTAFVIGDDCFVQRDNLLHALNQPGPGELVHPWYGRMMVTAGDGCDVSHDRREGGMVRFQLEFIEDGEKGYPVGVPHTARQLEDQSESWLDSAIARYRAAMAVINRVRIAAVQLQNGIADVQMAIQGEFSQIAGAISSTRALADMLSNAPDNLVTLVEAQFSGFSDGSRWGSEDDEQRGYALLAGLASNAAQAAVGLTAAAAPAGGQATVAMVTATRDLVRDALLIKAVQLAAQMPVVRAPATLPGVPTLDQQVATPVSRPEVPTTDDVLALRDALSDAIWQAGLSAPHAHFVELQDTQKKLRAHLSKVAVAGVRLVDVTPKESVPAVVLAYRLYGDATRADEIVTRNKVVHPGFLPADTLRCAQE
ncbi:DNA circularization protein [Pseudomonas mosselii]|uniref:DNA circularization protein n=1 Tax=Pseudomonas mosselii TaxID=78327 RepID=UPI0021616B59|nr:DNA circularization N-terminal domain-containing protein [Pseudomonas mosselii]UVN46245.1 DNA circularization N-terminal domain-containing protein [Pseudomonas mosselii]